MSQSVTKCAENCSKCCKTRHPNKKWVKKSFNSQTSPSTLSTTPFLLLPHLFSLYIFYYIIL